MARTGLYKSDVNKARMALLAQNKNPSVDAVRVALGNTGSKTTIHKYLKELEEENGGVTGRKTSISEALQDLVDGLAAQLQGEANTRIEAIRAEYAEKEHVQAEVLTASRVEITTLSNQLQRTESALQQEKAEHKQTQEALQGLTLVRHTLDQHVADLKDRLAENETHRLSLEEKHQHARQALEHYRDSVKEQREQDQRRHEQQVQHLQAEMRQLQQTLIVKQDELTRLSHEGARLIADLSHARKGLIDSQTHERQHQQKLETLLTVEQRCKALEEQLVERASRIAELTCQVSAAALESSELAKRLHLLDVDLSAARATIEAYQTTLIELRAYRERREALDEKAAHREPT